MALNHIIPAVVPTSMPFRAAGVMGPSRLAIPPWALQSASTIPIKPNDRLYAEQLPQTAKPTGTIPPARFVPLGMSVISM